MNLSTYNKFENKREVSCRVINTYLRYAEKEGKDPSVLLTGLPYDKEYLTDCNHWVPLRVMRELQKRMAVLFNDDSVFFKIGLSTDQMRSVGFIDVVARLMGGPEFVVKHAPRFHKYFSKVNDIELVSHNKREAKIKFISREGYEINKASCEYFKGVFTGLPTIWGADYAEMKEDTCSVPIDKVGVIKGKSYKVNDKGYVHECDVEGATEIEQAKVIGRVNKDGSFRLGETLYGAPYCLYHLSWRGKMTFLRKLFYNIFLKPKVLEMTIDELQNQHHLLQQKYEELYQKNVELQRHYVDTINALIRAIDAKDHYTEHHSINVCRIAGRLAEELNLAPEEIETIRIACQLHDLGKIGIPDNILLKPAKLTEEEWEEIKKHPILGSEIIKPLTFLSEVALLIRQDHERWDGKGYPDGLSQEQIELGARIIMIADSYDAMTSGRTYKKAMTKQEAIEEIRKNSGTQFDPLVVKIFLKILASEDLK